MLLFEKPKPERAQMAAKNKKATNDFFQVQANHHMSIFAQGSLGAFRLMQPVSPQVSSHRKLRVGWWVGMWRHGALRVELPEKAIVAIILRLQDTLGAL
jgi:hypothetical protein